MRKSAKTIVSLGILSIIFMSVMSMMYLQQIPNKTDLKTLEADLRSEFALVISAAAPLKLVLVEPEREGRRMGVEMSCTMRNDLRRRPKIVGHHLDRIAQYILNHRKWRGKIDLVTVAHAEPLAVSRTRRAPERS